MLPGRLALVLLALLWGAGAAVAGEDPETRARALFKRAEVHFSLGEFKQALRLYKEAYRVKQLPEFLFNIGQCHRHLGRCRDAVFYFRQFLLRQPRAPEVKQVNDLILECEAKMAADQGHPAPQSQPSSAPTVPRQPRLSPTWVWVGIGVTSSLLVAGTVTGVLARRANDEYKDPATSISRRLELKDQGESLELASWVTLGLGGAALGATIAFYFLGRPQSGDSPGSRLSLAPFEGGGLLQLRGRF